MKLADIDKGYYHGILAALVILARLGDEALYRKVVGCFDVENLVAFARLCGLMRRSGLSRYGYGRRK